MNYSKLKMIVCVGENNLIGDSNPKGNGLLWHSKEELHFFKSKTIGNVLLFGKKTAEVTPIELMRKNREVIILSRDSNIDEIINSYQDTDKDIFICGGYTIYKYFLENFKIDTIYLSKIKPNIEVSEAVSPLYLPKLEDYRYSISQTEEYGDFTLYVYKKNQK